MKKSCALLFVTVLAGCSSFRTTAVDRLDDHSIVVNPEKPIRGIPVSLRVPSHLELSIIETTYWRKINLEKDANKPGKPVLQQIRMAKPQRRVIHEVKETEKIFVVDPVRPGAGTTAFGFTFTSNNSGSEDAGKGYLDKVTYKIDDQTITQSATLLSQAIGFINAFPTGSTPTPTSADLVGTDRTIAFKRFDINSPTFEQDVEAFLDCNLNCAPKNCIRPRALLGPEGANACGVDECQTEECPKKS